jgi:hypothetical protein
MRNHDGFVVAVAAVAVAVGTVFVGLGVAQAQANSVAGSGLDTWGNPWFLSGFCVVLISVVALVMSIAMHFGWWQIGPKDELRAGRRLRIGRFLLSPNGRFRLDVQRDSNLVLYLAEPRQPLWASNTQWRDAKYLTMQKDGNLVLYTADHKPVFASDTDGRGGKRLVIQDDGKIVIYTDKDRPVWARPEE